jgi:D-glycero-D-manno-heptose 1,7-bisphosphate phosphatase
MAPSAAHIPPTSLRRAVFVDRDDTLIHCNNLPAPSPKPTYFQPGDLTDPALVELLPGVLESCRRFHAAGLLIVVVSNQGAVARQGATLAQVHAVNLRLSQLLTPSPTLAPNANPPHPSAPHSISPLDRAPLYPQTLLAAAYFCPFHTKGRDPQFLCPPTAPHPWQKPNPGMLHAAAADLNIDLAHSYMIGDAPRDLEAALAAGIPTRHTHLVGPTAKSFIDAAAECL